MLSAFARVVSKPEKVFLLTRKIISLVKKISLIAETMVSTA